MTQHQILVTRNGSTVDTITEVNSLRVKLASTSQIGNFSFSVPTLRHPNIQLCDTVKIWIDNVIGDPLFVGVVENIQSAKAVEGQMLKVTGHDESELFLRRFLHNRKFTTESSNTGVSDIILRLMTDFGMAFSLTVDRIETYHVHPTESYWDVIKYYSDHWADATNKIHRDAFTKNLSGTNTFYWKSRPIRTEGVETLAEGKNIREYLVTEDVFSVKNDITVFGAKTRMEPSVDDAWTENVSSPAIWSATYPVGVMTGVAHNCGSYSIRGYITSADEANKTLTITADVYTAVGDQLRIKEGSSLTFAVFGDATYGHSISAFYVDLLAPNTSSYFRFHPSVLPINTEWKTYELPLGASQETQKVSPATPDLWEREAYNVGSVADWYDVRGIRFSATFVNNVAEGLEFFVDCLKFQDLYYSAHTSNPTSQTSWKRRDCEETDETLASNADCLKRANEIAYLYADPYTQVDMKVNGNTNIKIGDRLSITLIDENIVAADYDVCNVEHFLTKEDFNTVVSLLNVSTTRKPQVVTERAGLLRQFNEQLKSLNKQIQRLSM